MLEVTYEEHIVRPTWRRPGRPFRNFWLSGSPTDLEQLARDVRRVAAGGEPAVLRIGAVGRPAWLMIARSDTGLEVVHLDAGMAMTGDAGALSEVGEAAEDVAEQGRARPGIGYHRHLMVHDWHVLPRRRDRGRGVDVVAELTVVCAG